VDIFFWIHLPPNSILPIKAAMSTARETSLNQGRHVSRKATIAIKVVMSTARETSPENMQSAQSRHNCIEVLWHTVNPSAKSANVFLRILRENKFEERTLPENVTSLNQGRHVDRKGDISRKHAINPIKAQLHASSLAYCKPICEICECFSANSAGK